MKKIERTLWILFSLITLVALAASDRQHHLELYNTELELNQCLNELAWTLE